MSTVPTTEQVVAALATVNDPEIHRPITELDMVKAVDKEMVIGGICLVEKTGGRSGHYRRRRSRV